MGNLTSAAPKAEQMMSDSFKTGICEFWFSLGKDTKKCNDFENRLV